MSTVDFLTKRAHQIISRKQSHKHPSPNKIMTIGARLWLPPVLAALLALAVCLSSCPSGSGASAAEMGAKGSSSSAAHSPTLAGFKLSKLFDFSEYKRIYGKRYTSALQELARMKIYLAGVLRVIVAAIKHRFLGKKYYLAVNRMTDWTDDEWHRVSMSVGLAKGEQVNGADHRPPGERHIEAADLGDIDTKLPEIFRGREATFQRFVDEIGQQDEATDATSAEDEDHRLSADKLFRVPQHEGAAYAVPGSNNPRYEPPEVMSQASANEVHTERPLASSDVEEISHSAGLLDNILDGLQFLFDASEQSAGLQEKKIAVTSEGPDMIFVDHRNSGCLRPPAHQLECGSCYAFATLALYEYMFCMQQQRQLEHRRPVQFSVQYLIDCGPRRDEFLKGCQGGNPIKVAEFVNRYGIELEANYPYLGEEQVCPYGDGDDDESASAMGYLRVDEPGLQQLPAVDFDEVLKRQPILVNIYPNSELKAYGGGIYENYACEFKYAHAMLLVGRGRKDNHEYWIIRNSLGPEWGEAGYLYMDKGAALNCLVDDGTISHATFPSAKKNPKYTMKDVEKVLPLFKSNYSST